MCNWKVSIGHDHNSGNIVAVCMMRMGDGTSMVVADNMSPAIETGHYPIQWTHIPDLEEYNARHLYLTIVRGAELVPNKRRWS